MTRARGVLQALDSVLGIQVQGLSCATTLPHATLVLMQVLSAALAMAGLGLSTHLGLLRQAGWRPLALGALLWATILVVAGTALAAGWVG